MSVLTVEELIEKLKTLPQDRIVFLEDSQFGSMPLKDAKAVFIRKASLGPIRGIVTPYELEDYLPAEDQDNYEPVVVLQTRA